MKSIYYDCLEQGELEINQDIIEKLSDYKNQGIILEALAIYNAIKANDNYNKKIFDGDFEYEYGVFYKAHKSIQANLSVLYYLLNKNKFVFALIFEMIKITENEVHKFEREIYKVTEEEAYENKIFIKFIKDEIPDVYKKLRTEFSKNKGNIGMVEELLERDRCCGNCKYLKFTKSGKSCSVRGLPSAGLSYADYCEKYQFNKNEIPETVEIDKEKNCYFYRFTLNKQEKIVYADTISEITEIIYKLNNIDNFLKTKETIGTLEFLEFMRKEIPEVYRKLRREFNKRKKVLQ